MACALQSLQAQPVDVLDSLLAQGRRQVGVGKYATAVRTYFSILDKDDVVPGEMCFLFAKALYHTHRLLEADRLLQLYQDRVSTDSPHQKAAEQLRVTIRTEQQRIDDCLRCNSQGYRYQPHALCGGTGRLLKPCRSCHGYGHILCGLCYGHGVIISLDNYQQRQYRTCLRCRGQGTYPCHACQGGQLRQACLVCQQTGKIIRKTLCDHTDSE